MSGARPSILVVEDDAVFADRLQRNLDLAGFHATVAGSAEKGLERLKTETFDLVVADVRLPGMSGLDLVRTVRRDGVEGVDADLPFVLLTSVTGVETAVEAMKLGAADYITKEAARQEVTVRIAKVLELGAIAAENRLLRDRLHRLDQQGSGFGDLLGDSPAMRRVKEDIEAVANSEVIVLITGETGSGKEMVARALHASGPTKQGPFIDVNCAALPDDNLFQSEVFGHEKGAFTDAAAQRRGLFEMANRGTLFLDEIAELRPDSQGKILKALEQQIITRLGSTKPIRVNCRLLFATNKDLKAEAEAGRFREDLYYRIDVYRIHIPPLRERRADVPVLAQYFLRQFSKKYRKPDMLMQTGALEALMSYAWPGNVRELRNVMERLMIRARGDVITADQVGALGLGPVASQVAASAAPLEPSIPAAPASDVPRFITPVENATGAVEVSESTGTDSSDVPADGSDALALRTPIRLPAQGVDLEEVERDLVIQALERADWNQKEAAQLLGISVDRMNARVKKFGLRHPRWRVHK